MPTTKKAAKSKKSVRKEKVAEISTLLKTALSKLKGQVDEKKFERKIKKAAKILVEGIKDTAKPAPVKKTGSGKKKK